MSVSPSDSIVIGDAPVVLAYFLGPRSCQAAPLVNPLIPGALRAVDNVTATVNNVARRDAVAYKGSASHSQSWECAAVLTGVLSRWLAGMVLDA